MLHLVHKLDYCSAGELPGKLDVPENHLSIPDAKSFDGEASAAAFCEANPVFEGGQHLVALVVLEPKLSPAVEKTIEKLKTRAAELAERIKTLAQVDPVTGQDTWLEVMKQEIITRTQAMKSKTKSCPNCPSSISVAHIVAFACPVCHSEDFLTTTGDQDKIRSREERIVAARTELAEVAEKAVKTQAAALADSPVMQKVWMVFGREPEVHIFDDAPAVEAEAGTEVEALAAGDEVAGGEPAGDEATLAAASN